MLDRGVSRAGAGRMSRVMEDPPPPPPSARVVHVAAHGLPGGLETSTVGPLADDEFASLLWQCEQDRLLGLLGAAVRADVVRVTGHQRDQLDQLLQAWLAHALRVERLLLDAAAALDAAGLEHRVLKGVALAHLAYPDPAWRVFGDLDLLVPAASLTKAVGVLECALGVSRFEAELRPGFDDRFGKEALLQAPGGPELDLHRTFAQGALGLTIDARRPLRPRPALHRRRAAAPGPPAQSAAHPCRLRRGDGRLTTSSRRRPRCGPGPPDPGSPVRRGAAVRPSVAGGGASSPAA